MGNNKIGLSWGRHKPECIERNGDFWHSKEKSGDRGVQVTFKEKVIIRSFEFQTRQDAGRFKINNSFQNEMKYINIVKCQIGRISDSELLKDMKERTTVVSLY